MDLQPITLSGRSARLEPMSEQHLDALCGVGLDPDLWRITVAGVANREEMLGYIRTALAAHAAGTALPFVTMAAESNLPVGSTRFMNIDHASRRVEIGSTWIAKPWQRTAINTEAKYLMLRHAFEVWGCVRVELKTDAINERSRAAIRRLGAKEEGILRRHTITWTGRVRDSVYFGITDQDWPRVKASLEARIAGRAG